MTISSLDMMLAKSWGVDCDSEEFRSRRSKLKDKSSQSLLLETALGAGAGYKSEGSDV